MAEVPQQTAKSRRLVRPDASSTTAPDPDSEREGLRQALGQAHAAYAEALARVEAFERSQVAAQDQLRAAAERLREVEASADFEVTPSDLAWGYTLGEQLQTRQAKLAAETAIAEARAELAQAEELERAVEIELDDLRKRLNFRRSSLYDAAADFVAGSRELRALLGSLDRAWGAIRAHQLACSRLGTRLSGRMPAAFLREFQRICPIALNDEFPGHPIDTTLATRWVEAIDRLIAGESTELPTGDL
jgi:predicted  nucleic acid-binding Zn-ribbon protein